MEKGMQHHADNTYVQDTVNLVEHVDITTHLNANHGQLMDHAKITTRINVLTHTSNQTYRDGHSRMITMTRINVPNRVVHDPHPEIHTRNPGE